MLIIESPHPLKSLGLSYFTLFLPSKSLTLLVKVSTLRFTTRYVTLVI